MRTIIDIPSDQIQALDRLRGPGKTSRAELIRAAVEAYLKEHDTPDVKDLPGFGAWKGKGEDGLDYQRRMREEWDR
ncbi:MAG: ribbon-helix-helix protein, CopG family [Candidatus Omnitrophica bacterium]|nr:hypothetical protein [bacterium]NUN95790.1 ribbon-helix-helix protein, CopG family [Candidatus Omnitrophota bacterium]